MKTEDGKYECCRVCTKKFEDGNMKLRDGMDTNVVWMGEVVQGVAEQDIED